MDAEDANAAPRARQPDASGASGEELIYLGLGSNLGDRDALLRAALARLTGSVRVTCVSSVWDTAPMLVTEQPRFHNIVAEGFTLLDPFALLRAVKAIERALGRIPGPRYGPRPIDIDILLYDNLTLDTPDLTIPHARLSERAFALAPLAEIAPQAWRPTLAQEAQALVAAAPRGALRRLGPLG